MEKKPNTEMPSRFMDVTDRELTQFLEKIYKRLMNNYYSLVHCLVQQV